MLKVVIVSIQKHVIIVGSLMVHTKKNGSSNFWNHLENQCKKKSHLAELNKQKLNFQACKQQQHPNFLKV